jgi:hypothetical protein
VKKKLLNENEDVSTERKSKIRIAPLVQVNFKEEDEDKDGKEEEDGGENGTSAEKKAKLREIKKVKKLFEKYRWWRDMFDISPGCDLQEDVGNDIKGNIKYRKIDGVLQRDYFLLEALNPYHNLSVEKVFFAQNFFEKKIQKGLF